MSEKLSIKLISSDKIKVIDEQDLSILVNNISRYE